MTMADWACLPGRITLFVLGLGLPWNVLADYQGFPCRDVFLATLFGCLGTGCVLGAVLLLLYSRDRRRRQASARVSSNDASENWSPSRRYREAVYSKQARQRSRNLTVSKEDLRGVRVTVRSLFLTCVTERAREIGFNVGDEISTVNCYPIESVSNNDLFSLLQDSPGPTLRIGFSKPNMDHNAQGGRFCKISSTSSHGSSLDVDLCSRSRGLVTSSMVEPVPESSSAPSKEACYQAADPGDQKAPLACGGDAVFPIQRVRESACLPTVKSAADPLPSQFGAPVSPRDQRLKRLTDSEVSCPVDPCTSVSSPTLDVRSSSDEFNQMVGHISQRNKPADCQPGPSGRAHKRKVNGPLPADVVKSFDETFLRLHLDRDNHVGFKFSSVMAPKNPDLSLPVDNSDEIRRSHSSLPRMTSTEGGALSSIQNNESSDEATATSLPASPGDGQLLQKNAFRHDTVVELPPRSPRKPTRVCSFPATEKPPPPQFAASYQQTPDADGPTTPDYYCGRNCKESAIQSTTKAVLGMVDLPVRSLDPHSEQRRTRDHSKQALYRRRTVDSGSVRRLALELSRNPRILKECPLLSQLLNPVCKNSGLERDSVV